MTGPAVVPRPLRLQRLSDQPFVVVPGSAVVAPDPAARQAAERLATLVGGSVQATAAPDVAAFRLRLLGPAGDEGAAGGAPPAAIIICCCCSSPIHCSR